MKNIKKHIKKIVLMMFLGMLTTSLMADPPDPDGPGSGGGPLPGGGAPIGGGSIIFIALAAAYGLKKTHQLSIIKDLE